MGYQWCLPSVNVEVCSGSEERQAVGCLNKKRGFLTLSSGEFAGE